MNLIRKYLEQQDRLAALATIAEFGEDTLDIEFKAIGDRIDELERHLLHLTWRH